MANIKKSVCALALSVVAVLSGCAGAEPEPSGSSADVTSETVPPTEDILSETGDSGSLEDQTSTDSAGEPDNDNDPHFSVLEKWVDDALVPDEWLPVHTTDEAMARFDEIAKADTSSGSASEIVLALLSKNVLFFETMYAKTYEINWDEPVETEDSEDVFYPITTPYFADIESIYELAYSTYKRSAAEELLFGTKEEPRVLFSEIDGRLCVNPKCISNWVHDPFYPRSYIEIIDKTEDCITFALHYPDFEKLNEPEEYQYNYYDYRRTAIYDGKRWLLDDLIIDNGIGRWDVVE